MHWIPHKHLPPTLVIAFCEAYMKEYPYNMNMYVCPCIQDIVVGMRFGRFGREDGALILVSEGGALSVKILKRSVNFEVKDTNPRMYFEDTCT